MPDMPVFVKISTASELRNVLSTLKQRIHEVHETMAQLDHLSLDEAAKMHEWNSRYEDLSRRIDDMVAVLHSPERV